MQNSSLSKKGKKSYIQATSRSKKPANYKSLREFLHSEGGPPRFALLSDKISLYQRIREIKALDRANLLRLALVSILLTSVDTVQSFYLQRGIDVFSEMNAIPRLFYGTGILGYVLYAPIEFLAVYVTLLVCWLWASYVLWYHKNIVVRRQLF